MSKYTHTHTNTHTNTHLMHTWEINQRNESVSKREMPKKNTVTKYAV